MSIRRYLVLILISIITLITFIAAIQGYKASMKKASDLFDAQLHSFATTLIALDTKQAVIKVNNKAALAFQIWQNKQLLLATSNTPKDNISAFKTGFSENNFNGMRWRVYAMQVQNTPKWVMVAQPIKPRFELAEKVILSAVIPIVLTIPLLSIIISLVVGRGLKPLTQLTKQLTKKKVNDLSKIKVKQTSEELVPVIETLNHLFQQLESAFEREKRFAADAAHELRTPLSVLKINSHNLQLELGNDNPAINHLVASVDRMAHVIDQILLLNKTNPEQFSADFTKLNLKNSCQQIIAQLYPEISARGQQIALEAPDAYIRGNDFAIATLLQNLISNASKYAPKQGHIILTIEKQHQYIKLTVEDSGQGIEAEELPKVFDRFYRVGGDRHNPQITGCGLGLAIVKHIVQLHNARIQLAKSPQLQGLMVNIVFLNAEHGNSNA